MLAVTSSSLDVHDPESPGVEQDDRNLKTHAAGDE